MNKFFIPALALAVSAVAACSDATVMCEHTELFKAGTEGYHTYRIPALTISNDGTILAFCEGRTNNHKDKGDIDLVLKRSTDFGKTWSELSVVKEEGENACSSPTPVVLENGRILLLSKWRNASYAMFDCRTEIQYSDDDGLSWSDPREITASVYDTTWLMNCVGPGHAIRLEKGEHKGRLIVPCYHKWTYPGEKWYGRSYLIYSDDQGETWQKGAFATAGNECMAAELSNGDIMLNMREFTIWNIMEGRHYQRYVAVSSDGGETLSEAQLDPNLPAAVCEGSIIRYRHGHEKQDWLLFMNPEGPEKRINLKVKLSKDGGKTWKVIYSPPYECGAYSDMVELPDGSVALLYEAGHETMREVLAFDIIPRKMIK